MKTCCLRTLLLVHLVYLIISHSKTLHGLADVDEVEIYDVFYSYISNTVESIQFASWDSRRRLQHLTIAQIKRQGAALRGRVIRMMTFQFTPYVILESLDAKRDKDSGYVPHVFDIIEKHLNIRLDLSYAKDKTFGMLLHNGTYTGGVGVLHRGESDMWGSVLGTSTNRSKVVRYLAALSFGFITMVINTPDSSVPPSIYFMPFRMWVWVCLLAGVIVILAELVLVAVLYKSELLVNGYQVESEFGYWIFSGEYFVTMLESAKGISGKVIASTLLLATLVTFTYYSSLLTSFLTFQEMKLPFKTLLEMSENNEYKVLLVKYSKYHEQFKMAKEDDQSYFRVWKKIVREGEKGLVPGFTEGYFQLIQERNQKYVLISDEPSVSYIDRSYCRVSYTPEKFNKDYLHAAVRKDFPYGNIISEVLNRLWGNGVMSRLKMLYLRSDQARCRPERKSQSLGFAQLLTPFAVLLCGCVAALIALAVEIGVCSNKYRPTDIPYCNGIE